MGKLKQVILGFRLQMHCGVVRRFEYCVLELHI